MQRVCLGIGLIHDERPTIDLAAHYLSLYVGDVIDVGVEVLPMKEMQENMSSGPGYYEGALYDLARQGRGVPAVPLVLIGVRP
ncbi:MAG: BglII/BstYI family type II restriction endonuclease [Phycisphaerae bacterium]